MSSVSEATAPPAVQYDRNHPANHDRCEPDCPCTCGTRRAYEANAGTICRNCWGMIERKRISWDEPVLKAAGVTMYVTRWAPVAPAA